MQETLKNSEPLNFDKIWLMFQETDRKFQETDRKFQESDKRIEKSSLETDRKLNKLEHLFNSQWSKLIESLVAGDLINLLNARGIKVHETSTRVKGFYNNRQYEFDIIAENGDEIVVVEVKTTLRPDDVKEFLEELNEFKSVRPKYNDNKVYGAVAYLTTESNSEISAAKKGLFTIRATGNSATITNNENFVPRAF